MNQNQLERYSFLWSLLRLVIAALALFLGGVPPIVKLFGVSFGLIFSWVVSGVTSAYLFYRWVKSGKMLFGGKDTTDIIAFLVMTISGINLGIAGLFGRNIGMSIFSYYFVYVLAAMVYLASAVYLYKRWSTFGQKLFP